MSKKGKGKDAKKAQPPAQAAALVPAAKAAPPPDNITDSPAFRSLIKAYDDKQYKKAIKLADQLLQKHPKHAETLSMKGLTIIHMDKSRRQEAHDLARQGVMYGLSSFTCWHVYGLLHRTDSNYIEAIQCYKRALKLDKENLQILRDLVTLQIQVRDKTGFSQTCLEILKLKPKLRNHWIALVVAYYLDGKYTDSLRVLESYRNTLEKVERNYEFGEMFMFENDVVESAHGEQAALQHLDRSQEFIVDELGLRVRRCELLRRLGEFERAEVDAWSLIESNTECNKYYETLEAIHCRWRGPLAQRPQSPQELIGLYEEAHSKLAKSVFPARRLLELCDASELSLRLRFYVEPRLRKGIPSLYADLKTIAAPPKAAVMTELFNEIRASLEKHKKFSDKEGEAEQSEEVLVWTLHLLAQHLDNIGEHTNALGVIDQAIQLDEKVLELYVAKARILKHLGRRREAAEVMDIPRKRDEADRWYNTKAALYLIRSGDAKRAETTVEKFAKAKNEQQNNLFDMQCSWWATEHGLAALERRNFPEALKQFHSVARHFATYVTDQLDFHTYCLRKMTLRAYVQLLEFEDGIYSHKYYVKAALAAVRTYLTLATSPKTTNEDEDPELAGLDDKERKKILSKRRREKARQEQVLGQQQQQLALQQGTGEESKEEGKGKGRDTDKGDEKDPPPDGDALAAVANPLEVASTEFLSKLNSFAGDWLETHALSAQVYLLRNKILLALRGVLRGLALMSKWAYSNTLTSEARIQLDLAPRAQLLVQLQAFLVTYKVLRDTLPGHVQAIVDGELAEGGRLHHEALESFLFLEYSNHPNSLLHKLAEFEREIIGSDGDKTKVLQALDRWVTTPEATSLVKGSRINHVRVALATAKRIMSTSGAKAFREVCVKSWPGSDLGENDS